jgi:hypothetical protein
LEARASTFCQLAREHGSAVVQMEWRKNYEGRQAVILDHRDAPMARTSGGGYDKESQALADALRFMGTTDDERMSIWRTGGAGERRTREALAALGWTLEKITSTRTSDTWTLARTS